MVVTSIAVGTVMPPAFRYSSDPSFRGVSLKDTGRTSTRGAPIEPNMYHGDQLQSCGACAAIRQLSRMNLKPLSGPQNLAPHHRRIHDDERARFERDVRR